MRFSIVSHAGLHLQARDISLLVDPWLFGSCYWRSWWHFPAAPPLDERWLCPTYVYLSHHHPDHFHYPSLRRLDRATHVLIPRYIVNTMHPALVSLGFKNITELPHAGQFALGGGLSIRSYQYGLDDSAIIVSQGDSVVANLNDCKIRGLALRQIVADNGPVTVMLKNFQRLRPTRVVIKLRTRGELRMISRNSYLVDFWKAAFELKTRYAVPFASNACFLHPDTLPHNTAIIRPVELEKFFAHNPLVGTDIVVMASGDSWSDDHGFVLNSQIVTRTLSQQ